VVEVEEHDQPHYITTKSQSGGRSNGLGRGKKRNEKRQQRRPMCKIAGRYGWVKACGIGVGVYRRFLDWQGVDRLYFADRSI
jgi:hypothetical protein